MTRRAPREPFRARSALALGIIFGLVAACVGVSVGIALAPGSVPENLRPASSSGQVPVSTTTTTDSKSGKVAVQIGPETSLNSNAEGVLTGFTCRAGQTIVSGTSAFSVNGDRLLNLATSSPLWRDIRYGAKGEDVRALQSELTRLGFPVYVDGVAGDNTARAVADLSTSLDMGLLIASKELEPGDLVFPLSRYVWLPTESVNVAACSAEVGSQITNGGALATASAQVESATVQGMKDLKIPGSRVLTLPDGSTLAVGDDGTVTEPYKLTDAVAEQGADAGEGAGGTGEGSSPDNPAAAGSDGSKSITLPLELEEPTNLSVVPAGSIVFDGGTSCVRSGESVVRVRVVGSKLGASVVLAAGKPGLGPNVDASPRPSIKC